MPFPSPALFGGGPPNGSITVFTLQPTDWFWIRSPRRGRVEYGQVQHGRDALALVFSSDVPIRYDEQQEFRALLNTAIANAGKIRLQHWDEQASSAAGAWVTERFIFVPPEGNRFSDGEANVYGFQLLFKARGTPLN